MLCCAVQLNKVRNLLYEGGNTVIECSLNLDDMGRGAGRVVGARNTCFNRFLSSFKVRL